MFDRDHGWNLTIHPLITGLIFSLILLTAAYFIVANHHLANPAHDIVLWSLGAFQALIQLFLFSHLGMRAKPQWPMISFLLMVLLILVVLAGTLWIISNLNYNMMPEMKSMPQMHQMPSMEH